MDFQLLRLKSHLTRSQIADLFGVTLKTVRNWERRGAPKPVKIALSLLSGDLSHIAPCWRGFRITPDRIEHPEEKIHATPGDIRALPYLYQAAKIQRNTRMPG